MDARRLRLYELLKPSLGEEPAQELVLALPANPEQLATKEDVTDLKEQLVGRFDSAFAAFEARLEVRFVQIDARFAEVNARFAQMEATLTRRMVAIMGAWTVSVASAFAWASVVFGG